MKLGIGGHQRTKGRTNEWLTPPWIIDALGPFDLDPCAPVGRPWNTAKDHHTIEDDGLEQPWHGRVWLNPPYGSELIRWLARLAQHGNGIALTFARTETEAFEKYVWPKADAMLFMYGRIHFYDVTGQRAKANSGGPSVLIAYNYANAAMLKRSGIHGRFVALKECAA